MLSLPIIEMIKKKSGLDFNNAKDFEVLSESFPASDRLGVNTLKRLMGYAKSPIAPRKATQGPGRGQTTKEKRPRISRTPRASQGIS